MDPLIDLSRSLEFTLGIESWNLHKMGNFNDHNGVAECTYLAIVLIIAGLQTRLRLIDTEIIEKYQALLLTFDDAVRTIMTSLMVYIEARWNLATGIFRVDKLISLLVWCVLSLPPITSLMYSIVCAVFPSSRNIIFHAGY